MQGSEVLSCLSNRAADSLQSDTVSTLYQPFSVQMISTDRTLPAPNYGRSVQSGKSGQDQARHGDVC